MVFGMHHFFACKIQRISVGFKDMKLVISRVIAFGGLVFCSYCLGIFKNFVIGPYACKQSSVVWWVWSNDLCLSSQRVLATCFSIPMHRAMNLEFKWLGVSLLASCFTDWERNYGKLGKASILFFKQGVYICTQTQVPQTLSSEYNFVEIKRFMWGWKFASDNKVLSTQAWEPKFESPGPT